MSRHFVFLRNVAPTTYLLFYHRGEQPKSYTLRDYSGGGKPRLIRGRDLPYSAEQVLKQAADRLAAPEHDLADHAFWREIILELNRHLAAHLPSPGGRAGSAGAQVQVQRYPVLALPELLRHGTKRSRPEDLARILHSPGSGDWVTWNCVRLLAGIDPAAWWPRLVELARAENPALEIAADPRDLPELETWARHPAPAGQSAGLEPTAGAEQAAGAGPALWIARGLMPEPEPAPDETEVDLTIRGRAYLVHVDAKIEPDQERSPSASAARGRILRRLDVLLEAAQDRRAAYWMLVRQGDHDQAQAQAVAELRRRPRDVAAKLRHRPADRIEALCKNLAVLRWADVVQYLLEFYGEVFKEMDRRVRR